MSRVIRTNEYRCLEQCKNCPFKDNGKSIGLREGRVDSIKKDLLNNYTIGFSCHKTVHNLDIDMNPVEPEQENKFCFGAYEFLKKQERPNLLMVIGEKFEKRKRLNF